MAKQVFEAKENEKVFANKEISKAIGQPAGIRKSLPYRSAYRISGIRPNRNRKCQLGN